MTLNQHVIASVLGALVDDIRAQFYSRSGEEEQHLERLRVAVDSALEKSRTLSHVGFNELARQTAGIHYVSDSADEWVLLGFEEEPTALQAYRWILDGFDPKNHFLVPPIFGYPFSLNIASDLLNQAEDIARIRELVRQIEYRKKVTRDSTREQLSSLRVAPELLRAIVQDIKIEDDDASDEVIGTAKEGLLGWFQAEPALKLASMFLLSLRKARPLPSFQFYTHPLIGGYATTSMDGDDSSDEHVVFRQTLELIAILDGHFKSLDESTGDYARRRVTDSLRHTLLDIVPTYLRSLVRPKPVEGGDSLVALDDVEPFVWVTRQGNKSQQLGNVLIVRLKAVTQEAINFLYADNATILNKIQGFLDGLLLTLYRHQDFVREHYDYGIEPQSKVTIDVYLSPQIRDVSTRELNLYAHQEMRVHPESFMATWYSSLDCGSLEPHEDGSLSVPSVVYRFSETVGPSIFVGELASVLVTHFLGCERGGKAHGAPFRVLNLFSGTGSCELTLSSRLGDDARRDVSVLSLDLNPISLDEEFEKRLRLSHAVPCDVFGLATSEQIPGALGGAALYRREYDLVVADPPHYLVLDYLFHKVAPHPTGERKYVLEQMADDRKVKAFLLYFGHKEVEWTNLYLHWQLLRMKWSAIWHVLIGDERLVICFGKNSCIDSHSQSDCCRSLKREIAALGTRYPVEGREPNKAVCIYDTFWREP